MSCDKIEVEDIMKSDILSKETVIDDSYNVPVEIDLYLIDTDDGYARMEVARVGDTTLFFIGVINNDSIYPSYKTDDYSNNDLLELYEFLDSIPDKDLDYKDVYFKVIKDMIN